MSAARAAQRRVIGAEVSHHRLLVFAFVELGVLERDRERAHRRVGEAADHRDDARRIEPAAQVRADRHVGAQLQAHRIDQQRAQFFGRLFDRIERAAVCRLAGNVQSQYCVSVSSPSRFDRQQVPGRQALHALEHGVRIDGAPRR